MRRLLLAAAYAIAATVAVALHVPSARGFQTPFQRGTYAILAEAEDALAADTPGLALKHFRAAYVRAQYEGQPGVAERIRRRMGLAGRDLFVRGSSQSWIFLEAYALLSDDFGRDAMEVEELCLSVPAAAPRTFEYHLTRPDGQSYWGDSWATEWTGLWAPRRQWDSLLGRRPSEGIYTDMGSGAPDAPFGSWLTLYLRSGMNPVSGVVTLASPPGSHVVGCRYSREVEFKCGSPIASSVWILPEALSDPTMYFPRVAVFTADFPPPRGYPLVLTREYKSL